MALSTIVNILIERDGLTRAEAVEQVRECRAAILEAVETGDDDPEEVLLDMLGLEPDYILDFLGF